MRSEHERGAGFQGEVRPLGDGDLAFDLIDTPDTNRRVRVGRLRVTKGSG